MHDIARCVAARSYDNMLFNICASAKHENCAFVVSRHLPGRQPTTIVLLYYYHCHSSLLDKSIARSVGVSVGLPIGRSVGQFACR